MSIPPGPDGPLRNTRPEPVVAADLVELGRLLAEHLRALPSYIEASAASADSLAKALEDTAAERDRLKPALKRRIRMVHETRAERDAARLERDRAHATLRRIVYLDEKYDVDPGALLSRATRLARERLEADG